MTDHDVDAVVERMARDYYTACCVEHPEDVTWEELTVERREFFRIHTKSVLGFQRSGDRLPGGLRVVPEEPSEAMAIAALNSHETPVWRAVYRAMLKASSD